VIERHVDFWIIQLMLAHAGRPSDISNVTDEILGLGL
jgi:hypothetical protein